jgi:hypothetical protein
MEIGLLLVLGAFAFTVLAGSIELWLAWRTRRSLVRKPSPPLHPLTRRVEVPRLRSANPRRWLRYVGFFVGFLIASYVGLTLVKALYRVIEPWL